jgi:hypothetical protein
LIVKGYFKMAAQFVVFSHDDACERLVKDIKKNYGVDCKVKSGNDKFSKTGGQVHSVEFILPGDGITIKNIKINQSTSALHPSCKAGKNMFQIYYYLLDESKEAIYKLWGNSDIIEIGNITLQLSEFPDQSNQYHGLVSFRMACELNKVGENIKSIFDNVKRLAGLSPEVEEVEEVEEVQEVEEVEEVRVNRDAFYPAIKPVSFQQTKQTQQTPISYSAVAKTATVLSVSSIHIEEEYETEEPAVFAPTKSEGYKNALNSNAVKLKNLDSEKSRLLKEKEENEKQLTALLERIDSNNKKLDSNEKAMLQIKDNDAKITEKIKEEVKNLSALINSVSQAKVAEVEVAEVEVAEVEVAEVKVAEVTEIPIKKKKNKSKAKAKAKLSTVNETPDETLDENSGVTPELKLEENPDKKKDEKMKAFISDSWADEMPDNSNL